MVKPMSRKGLGWSDATLAAGPLLQGEGRAGSALGREDKLIPELVGSRRGVTDAAIRQVRIGGGLWAALDGGAGAGRPHPGVDDRKVRRRTTRPCIRNGAAVNVEVVGADGLVVVAQERGGQPTTKCVLPHRLGRVLDRSCESGGGQSD